MFRVFFFCWQIHCWDGSVVDDTFTIPSTTREGECTILRCVETKIIIFLGAKTTLYITYAHWALIAPQRTRLICFQFLLFQMSLDVAMLSITGVSLVLSHNKKELLLFYCYCPLSYHHTNIEHHHFYVRSICMRKKTRERRRHSQGRE